MDLEIRLAELLCTRLCHDLTGPIGAVNNGAEFLTEEGFSLQGQALELIVGSAQQAVIRLQYYRQAYGKVNYQGEASLNEVRGLATSLFKDSRYVLQWPEIYTDSAGVSVSRKMAKVILNMLVIVSSALPRGGELSITIEPNGNGSRVSVQGVGEGARFDETMRQALSLKTDIAEIDPKTAQPYFLGRLAGSIDVSIEYLLEDGKFTLIAQHA